MSTASVTNTFVNAATADADEVNTNFSDLVTFLNGSVVHTDGSKAFTGVVSGVTPTAAAHLVRKDYADALITDLGWTSYTPTWSDAGASPPELGNGSLDADYLQISKQVWIRLYLVMGSTTTYGTAGWTFSLPTPAAALTGARIAMQTTQGASALADSSQTDDWIQLRTGLSSTTAITVWQMPGTTPGALGTVAADTPFTWAATDQLRIYFSYEAA